MLMAKRRAARAASASEETVTRKILPPENLGTFFEEARRSGVFELSYVDLATASAEGSCWD